MVCSLHFSTGTTSKFRIEGHFRRSKPYSFEFLAEKLSLLLARPVCESPRPPTHPGFKTSKESDVGTPYLFGHWEAVFIIIIRIYVKYVIL